MIIFKCNKCGNIKSLKSLVKTKLENKYPEHIMKILKIVIFDRNESLKDSFINNLTPNEVLKEVLEWEGIIGYDNRIKNYINDIYKIDLNKESEVLSL